ncbi:hypothetical protein GCM10029964_080550 [Kibdelosporangium lantanae]
MEALAQGRSAPGLVTGVATAAGKTVFVFPGQGSQWVGMAVELLDTNEVFAERMAECAAALGEYVDWDLIEVLRERQPLERVDVIQAALFAVMVSLARMWESAGVRPDAVVGHSQGEIAAACVAGALSLRDAARVVALRSRAIRAIAGLGGMASIPLPVEEVRPLLTGDLGVAAVNGPSVTVVSGAAQAIDDIVAAIDSAKRIPVDYASHSSHVDTLEADIMAALRPITPSSSDIAFYSTVTGEPIDTSTLDAGYWFRNLRQTVRFEDAVRALLADGHGTFVECSPHPVLTIGVQQLVDDQDVIVTGSLRRDTGLERMLESIAEVHVRGGAVDWSAFVPKGTGSPCRRIRSTVRTTGSSRGRPATRAWSACERRSTRCWARPSSARTGVGRCSPAGCHCGPTHGWPTTLCRAR